MNPEIMTLAKQFHIGILSRGKFMPQQGLSNEEYLLEILRAEAESRDKKAEAERIKQARLPTYKGFDEFDTNFQKGITREQLDTLAKLEWIDGIFNLVLIGPPGTGNYRKYFFIERNEAIIHINQRIKPRFLLIILQLAAEVIQPLKQFCVIFPFGDILCYYIGITLFKNRMF